MAHLSSREYSCDCAADEEQDALSRCDSVETLNSGSSRAGARITHGAKPKKQLSPPSPSTEPKESAFHHKLIKKLKYEEVRELLYRSGKGVMEYCELASHFRLPATFDLTAWNAAINKLVCPPPDTCNISIAMDNLTGRPLRLNIFSRLRVCAEYNSPSGCPLDGGDADECRRLHLCRFFLADASDSKHPQACPQQLNHDFQNSLTRRCLARIGLGQNFKNAEARALIAAAHPRVCKAFNKRRGCPAGDTCEQLHICNNIFLGPCSPACDKVGDSVV